MKLDHLVKYEGDDREKKERAKDESLHDRPLIREQ